MNRVAANLPARLSSSSEEITMEPDGLQTFIDDVGLVVSSTDDEYEITKRVAEGRAPRDILSRLAPLRASGRGRRAHRDRCRQLGRLGCRLAHRALGALILFPVVLVATLCLRDTR